MTTKAASTQRGTLFGALTTLADEIKTQKQAAATKTAAPTPADPGGYQGATTHPTKDVDNRGQDASEGARSSENTSDVKDDQPVGVDHEPEAKPGQDLQGEVTIEIGTQPSATGEDPSVEDAYKGDKDDPGTSHPAKTEDGEKYGSFKAAYAKSISLGNSILADLANGFGDRLLTKVSAARQTAARKLAKKAADESAAKETPEGSDHSSDPESRPETSAPMTPAGGSAEGEHVQPGGGENKSASAQSKEGQQQVDKDLLKTAAAKAAATQPSQPRPGYELASMLGVDDNEALRGVQGCLGQTIKDAQFDADLFGSFYTTLQEKRAMPPENMGNGEGGEGEDHSQPGDEASGASDAAGDGGGEGGEGGGGGLGDLLGGGAGGGGDMMGGGGPSEEEAIAQLAAALDELGIPLEALMEAGGGGGGGDMGGAPPMGGEPPMGAAPPMGGAPPMGPAGGPPGMEVAAAAQKQAAARQAHAERVKLANIVREYKRSGKYQFKAAGNAGERQLRDVMKTYVQELMSV